MIPPFDAHGNLPPGIHGATWEETAARYGTSARRKRLLGGLKAALDALRTAGCRTAYLNGSFIAAKPDPNDFDGCWEMMGVDPARLDPVLLTFDRGRVAQKAKYGGELFPASAIADRVGFTFLEFFQIDRSSGRQKGIIALDLGSLP